MSEEKKMFCFEVDVLLQREIKALACKKGVPLNKYMGELLQAHLDAQKEGEDHVERNVSKNS